MEDINTHWTFPPRGSVKVNVHGTFTSIPLAKGNNSGIGVVIRDNKGRIKAMVSGTIQGLDERSNHLYAMLVGLRRAFLDKKYKIILETDDQEAINEWRNSKNFMHPERSYVLGQLNEIEEDLLKVDVACVQRASNRLAIYLARNGAETRRSLVNIDVPFGRVHELWCYDMGLEPAERRFSKVDKEDQINMEEDGEVMDHGRGAKKVVD